MFILFFINFNMKFHILIKKDNRLPTLIKNNGKIVLL